MRTCLLLALCLGANPAFAETRRIAFHPGDADPARDPHFFAYSPEVVFDAARGTVRLAKSVLVADEIGGTDYTQTLTLTDRVWAKKTFELDAAEAESAELLFFGTAGEVTVNGERLAKPERLPSTGWYRVGVSPRLLKAGSNEVILKGPGQILIEPTAKPGRSARSTDGGQTWSGSDVGGKGHTPGEYVVRLRLGRYAKGGWAESSAIDLWAATDGIGRPGKLAGIKALDVGKQPDGTTLRPLVRLGPTPQPGDRWTAWAALDKDYTPPAEATGFRWAQLRFELATGRPLAGPELGKFQLDFEITPEPAPAGTVRLVKAGPTTARDALPASVPFAYQEPSARLVRLRQRHKLDEVIAPGKTEMEQLQLLRHWVRNQWHTAWEGGSAAWMPPWDALVIFDCMDRPDCLTMCTHYSVVFTQCCLALGWTARHCILDHHCTAEVYVNQYRKWVMMDAGNSKERPDCTLHFERAGVPLSALELQAAMRSVKTADLTVHFTPPALMEKLAPLVRPAPAAKGKADPRPDTIPAAELPKYPVCGLANYRRYAFPARNNYLASPLPGEAYQGWSEYFYDGYSWVGDSPDRPEHSPEYSRHLTPDRPQDIDWSLNWVRAHLATGSAGELRVQLETRTPNLARVEVRHGTETTWKPTPAEFAWKLQPGNNVLTVRSVNKFDRPGPEERVEVEWSK
jgi:hypothetical protein